MDTYYFRKQIHRLPGKVIHAVPLPEPEVLKKFFAEVFPPEYITLIDGGHDVADMCLPQRSEISANKAE